MAELEIATATGGTVVAGSGSGPARKGDISYPGGCLAQVKDIDNDQYSITHGVLHKCVVDALTESRRSNRKCWGALIVRIREEKGGKPLDPIIFVPEAVENHLRRTVLPPPEVALSPRNAQKKLWPVHVQAALNDHRWRVLVKGDRPWYILSMAVAKPLLTDPLPEDIRDAAVYKDAR